MRKVRTSILAGAAALAAAGVLAGSAALAANSLPMHRLTIRLPGGGVEHIEYTGNAKPQVTIMPAESIDAATFADPFWNEPVFLGATPEFAGFDRVAADMNAIEAQMDRDMNAMLQQAQSLAKQMPDANAPFSASFSNLPAGTESYSFVSTSNGGHFCSRMTTVTANGHGKPAVVTKTSGDCGGGAASTSDHPSSPKSSI